MSIEMWIVACFVFVLALPLILRPYWMWRADCKHCLDVGYVICDYAGDHACGCPAGDRYRR